MGAPGACYEAINDFGRDTAERQNYPLLIQRETDIGAAEREKEILFLLVFYLLTAACFLFFALRDDCSRAFCATF